MLSEREIEEITGILGAERVEAIRAYTVERERQRYSDDALWAMLDERQERMASLLKTMGKVGTMLSVCDDDFEMWRSEIDRFSREYAGHVEFCDRLIWHMGKRGLLDPANWREGWQDFIRASTLDWYGWPN